MSVQIVQNDTRLAEAESNYTPDYHTSQQERTSASHGVDPDERVNYIGHRVSLPFGKRLLVGLHCPLLFEEMGQGVHGTQLA